MPRSIAGIDYYRRAAQTAERGKFDLFFVGDMLAAREKDGRVVREGGLNNIDFDLDHLGDCPAVTECLGLVATLSTTYNEPYYIAERFASLDHISNGRAGWNIITTANDDAAYNFGQKTHMEKRAATTARRSSSISARNCGTGRAIRPPRRSSATREQRALWDLPRSPQGWPVMFQAGGRQPAPSSRRWWPKRSSPRSPGLMRHARTETR